MLEEFGIGAVPAAHSPVAEVEIAAFDFGAEIGSADSDSAVEFGLEPGD